MVDRAIQGDPIDIWDHTSHMREYMMDPILMRNRTNLPNEVSLYRLGFPVSADPCV